MTTAESLDLACSPCPHCGGIVDSVGLDAFGITWTQGERITLTELQPGRAIVCPSCCIGSSDPMSRRQLEDLFELYRVIRTRTGNPVPRATMYVFEGHAPNDFEACLYAFPVKSFPRLLAIPRGYFPSSDASPDIRLVFPIIHLWRPGIPAILEARWSLIRPSDSNFVHETIGASSLERLGDLETLTKGLRLVHDFARSSGGRPPDDRAQRSDEFLSCLPAAVERARSNHLRDYGEETLRQRYLAAEFGFSEDTLQDRLAEVGLRWEDLKRPTNTD